MVATKRKQFAAAMSYLHQLIDAGRVAPNANLQEAIDRAEAIQKLARKIALEHKQLSRQRCNAVEKAIDVCQSLGLPYFSYLSHSTPKAWPYAFMKCEFPFPAILFEL